MGALAGGIHGGGGGGGGVLAAEEVLGGGGGEAWGGVDGGGVSHFEVSVFIVIVVRVVILGWGGRACDARSESSGLMGKREVGGGVGRFEVCDALLEVAEVVDACLEDGEFVHFLVATGGDHVLQDAELLVHL